MPEEKRESRMDSNASALSFLVNAVRHAAIYDESIVRSRNCAVCHDKSSLRLTVRIMFVAISLLVCTFPPSARPKHVGQGHWDFSSEPDPFF